MGKDCHRSLHVKCDILHSSRMQPYSSTSRLANTTDDNKNNMQIVVKQYCTISVPNLDAHPRSLVIKSILEAGSPLPWNTCHRLSRSEGCNEHGVQCQ